MSKYDELADNLQGPGPCDGTACPQCKAAAVLRVVGELVEAADDAYGELATHLNIQFNSQAPGPVLDHTRALLNKLRNALTKLEALK